MRGRNGFSISRWWSIVRKEFLQLRRDRITFAMIVGIPIIQMALFGYAISWRRTLEVQARLLGRVLLGELPRYPNFRTR